MDCNQLLGAINDEVSDVSCLKQVVHVRIKI